MKKQISSIGNAEYYHWGENCEGWHLVKSPELSIIEEKMPPDTSESRHRHRYSQQFFYILEGEAVFEINGEEIEVKANNGIYIPANNNHCIYNRTEEPIRFLVISQPTAKGDRIEEENRKSISKRIEKG